MIKMITLFEKVKQQLKLEKDAKNNQIKKDINYRTDFLSRLGTHDKLKIYNFENDNYVMSDIYIGKHIGFRIRYDSDMIYAYKLVVDKRIPIDFISYKKEDRELELAKMIYIELLKVT